MEENSITFEAKITGCRYYSDESSWGVYLFSTLDDIPHYTEQTVIEDTFSGDKEEKLKFSVLAGKMQELVIGGIYTVTSKTKKDKVYGYQYVPITIQSEVPKTKEDQLLFLKSIISETVAENLINAYPNVVNDVANGSLKEIDYSKVKGVRELTWKRIKDKIINNFLISDILVMLKPLGVTFTMIKKLLEHESNPVLLKKTLEDNPYILTKINGLGFKKVDSLALKLKPELLESTERLVAYITYYFNELGESDGHTWCTYELLKYSVSDYVPECMDKLDWLLENNDFLHIENDKVGLKYYYYIEMKILNLFNEHVYKKPSFVITEDTINKAIQKSEEEQGFQYVEEQKKVIFDSLNRNVSLISGKAGTGKSSIMRAIINAYKMSNYNVSASALSAMAAQRITEATNYNASTIHRTLGCKGLNIFEYNKDYQLLDKIVFLDEGSMVNANIFLHWLEAINPDARIIICGDDKQLPPIGYGNVFSDLIHNLDKNVVSKLTKPMRQALKSGILVDANLIRDNKNPITETLQPKIVHGELQDMFYMFRTNRESLFNIAIKTFFKSIETDGIDNVVIAVPRRQGCLNSTEEINKTIQDKLLKDVSESISFGEKKFKLGAKVMQTVNDYDKNVFNGEIGYITEIGIDHENNKKEEFCIVTYRNTGKDKCVKYSKKEIVFLDLAYALTVHKLQGSGRKTVIGIIDNTHYALLDNCMLYTLLTRAKKRCLLLAEPQAFLKCIRTSHNKRNTWMSL